MVLLPVDGGTQQLLLRADGLASIGLGLFGGLIAVIPFRRGERWAWWALWFYPGFWTVHRACHFLRVSHGMTDAVNLSQGEPSGEEDDERVQGYLPSVGSGS